jgi:Capsule polysaccharide biosynthesis protein
MSCTDTLKIGIYTRHKLQAFSAKLASELRSEFNVFIFSEDNISGADIIDSERYFTFEGNIDFLTNEDIDEIRLRCRVLRSIDRDLALSLIFRSVNAVQGMLSDLNPDVIISPRIDDYYLDILERICVKNNINFIGLWRSAFIDKMFFRTSRGEYNKLREPAKEEIFEFIENVKNKKFKATSIVGKKYSIMHSLSRYFKLYARALSLEVIRRFSTNKYRYRELATRFFVREYNISFFDTLYNYRGWKKRLDVLLGSKNPKVFIALQVNPESTIDYYCENIDLVDVSGSAPIIVDIFLSHGFDVIVKDHPNMIGNRDSNFLRKLASRGERVVIVPPSVDSIYLIDNTDVTYTWSGTVAVQAVMLGRKAVCVCVPYYVDIGGFFKISSLEDLAELLYSNGFSVKLNCSQDELRMLAEHILSSHLPGEIYLHNNDMPCDVLTTAKSLRKLILSKGEKC